MARQTASTVRAAVFRRPGNALLAAGELLFQPNTAVILFYVLSGFVFGEFSAPPHGSGE